MARKPRGVETDAVMERHKERNIALRQAGMKVEDILGVLNNEDGIAIGRSVFYRYIKAWDAQIQRQSFTDLQIEDRVVALAQSTRQSDANIASILSQDRGLDISHYQVTRARLKNGTRRRRPKVSTLHNDERASPSSTGPSTPGLHDANRVDSDPDPPTADSPARDNSDVAPSRSEVPAAKDFLHTASIESVSRASMQDPETRKIETTVKSSPSTGQRGQLADPLVLELRGKRWKFESVEEKARILAEVVAHQLDVMHSLFAAMSGDKAVLRRQALQCERHLDDYLSNNNVKRTY